MFYLHKRKLRVRAIPSTYQTLLADISELELGNKFIIEDLKTSDYIILHSTIRLYKVRTSRASIEVEEVENETTEDSEEGRQKNLKVVLPQNNFYNI